MHTSIEQRLSVETLDTLGAKTRKGVAAVERSTKSLRGEDRIRHLFVLVSRYKKRVPEAAAAALDALVLELATATRQGRVTNECKYHSRRIIGWTPRKTTNAESRIWVAAAQAQLLGVSASDLKVQLGKEISRDQWSRYSAYTLCVLATLFEGNRAKEIVNLALDAAKSLTPEARVWVYARLQAAGYESAERKSLEYWNTLCSGLSTEAIAALPTAILVSLCAVRREDSAALVDKMLLRALLSRADRHEYRLVEALAASAYPISRDEELRELVRSELALFPTVLKNTPRLIAEFAKFGVVPMGFLAARIKPYLESASRFTTMERLQIFVAMATLGKVDPLFASQVFKELIAIVESGNPILCFCISDAIFAFAICDALQGTTYTEVLLEKSRAFLRICYDQLNDRERMRIGRAALLVQGQRGCADENLGRNILPKDLRNSLRRIVHQIEGSPPRQNLSEEQFITKLRRALPGATVTSGGFAATHHLDATVELNGRLFDVELDGRVHEVYTLLGSKIGQRGEDALRDFNVQNAGYGVVRFSRDELESTDFVEIVRKRFAHA